MKKAWLSLVVSTCIVGSIVAFGHAQEFPEDELVEEQAVVITFKTGLMNKGKIRQIYKHTEKRIIGWEPQPPKPIHGERDYLYTYLPHPVIKVPQKRVQIIEEHQYRALPQVGVTSSSTTHSKSSQSSTTHRKSSYLRKRR